MRYTFDVWPIWKYCLALIVVVMSALVAMFIAHFDDIVQDVRRWLDADE